MRFMRSALAIAVVVGLLASFAPACCCNSDCRSTANQPSSLTSHHHSSSHSGTVPAKLSTHSHHHDFLGAAEAQDCRSGPFISRTCTLSSCDRVSDLALSRNAAESKVTFNEGRPMLLGNQTTVCSNLEAMPTGWRTDPLFGSPPATSARLCTLRI